MVPAGKSREIFLWTLAASMALHKSSIFFSKNSSRIFSFTYRQALPHVGLCSNKARFPWNTQTKPASGAWESRSTNNEEKQPKTRHHTHKKPQNTKAKGTERALQTATSHQIFEQVCRMSLNPPGWLRPISLLAVWEPSGVLVFILVLILRQSLQTGCKNYFTFWVATHY